MRWSAAAAVLLVVLAASLALNAYQYSSPRSVTSTTTSTQTTTMTSQRNNTVTTTETTSLAGGGESSSVLSANGLQLTVAVDATMLTMGQRVNVSMSILNTLPKTNTVLPSSNWSFHGIAALPWFLCGGEPAEVVVFKGSYDAQELRTIINASRPGICLEALNVDHFIFQHESDQVTLTGIASVPNEPNSTLGPLPMGINFTVTGYWDPHSILGSASNLEIGYNGTGADPPYIPFDPGVYTIAVADEWGQAVILHLTVTAPSNTIYGSFTYTPTGPVQVDSVRATETQAQNGRQNVTFWVTFENIDNSPIYFIGGWISELSSSVSTNSSVLQQVPSLRCPGAIYITTLNHGQNYTVVAPDCSTGFNYQLVHPGSVNVLLSFNWTTDSQENTPFSNSTTISANFTFA